MSVNAAGKRTNEGNDEERLQKSCFKLPVVKLRTQPGISIRDNSKPSNKRLAIEDFHKANHTFQSFAFAMMTRDDYARLNKMEMGIWESLEVLNKCVDEGDPGFKIQHLLQTAEAFRRDFPAQDWLHLTALIHDLGKVLMLPPFGGLPPWAVVGETFPLGCAFSDSVVYYKYFAENIDSYVPTYNTKLGIYRENCGLDEVTMSWGHGEYMYLVAKYNNTILPPLALFIIRFQSFYALHHEGAYTYLMNDEDKEMLKWLQLFSKYNLNGKSKERINVEEVKPYYLSLIHNIFQPVSSSGEG